VLPPRHPSADGPPRMAANKTLVKRENQGNLAPLKTGPFFVCRTARKLMDELTGTSKIEMLVFPVALFAFADPFDCRVDALVARLIRLASAIHSMYSRLQPGLKAAKATEAFLLA